MPKSGPRRDACPRGWPASFWRLTLRMSWRPAKPHQAGTSRALVQGSQSWGGVCRDRAREPLTHHSKVALRSSTLTERSLAGQPGAAPQGAGMRISGVPALLNMLPGSGALGPAGPPRQAWPPSLFLLPCCWVPTDCGLPWPPGPALLTPGPCCPCLGLLGSCPSQGYPPTPHHPQPPCPSQQGDRRSIGVLPPRSNPASYYAPDARPSQ